jgi:hypothetical protein
MIRRALSCAALFGMLGGCATPIAADAVSVPDVIRNIHAWNGTVVTVEGWLGTCAGLDCGLFSSLADARLVAARGNGDPHWLGALKRGLSIGYSERFDRRAAPLQFHHVIVVARVSDECRDPPPTTICVDRVDDLWPIAIHAATPREHVN